MASAMIVSIGLMPMGPGNRLASATNSPRTPWTAPKLSVTPRRGSSLIRAVPIRWIEYTCIEALGTGRASSVPQLAGAADLGRAVEGEQHPARSRREQRLPGQLDAADQRGPRRRR